MYSFFCIFLCELEMSVNNVYLKDVQKAQKIDGCHQILLGNTKFMEVLIYEI